ncbi:MAG: hypothetical protein RBS40_14260 [Rhodocyclaceae bacterium]|jgi:hypothetical protein|nr:hypothetical protein [Rhodocyclaceae bacterium]
MKMFSKEGMEMMDVKSIVQDGDNLVMKGKVMGSINAIIVIKPEDAWQALKLLGVALLFRMPAILLKGYLQSRKQAQAQTPV